MHFDDLRQFIVEAEKLGEVERINGADPHLAMGAIFAINGQGPNPKLILFDEIKGYQKATGSPPMCSARGPGRVSPATSRWTWTRRALMS